MLIFPAIDLFEGKAVRLYKGDYAQMTVYGDDPPRIAEEFRALGATHIHIVDLEGAKSGAAPNFDTILAIKERSGLFCEAGGGLRSMEAIDRCLSAGIDRAILGTAAVTEKDLVRRAVSKYGERIAVGVDIKDGFAAVRGWTESSALRAEDLCAQMREAGVRTLICTDVSRDGAMRGANHDLCRRLAREFDMQIIASGGVSSLEDVRRLREAGLYGAVIGRAYYTGAVDLREAIEVAG